MAQFHMAVCLTVPMPETRAVNPQTHGRGRRRRIVLWSAAGLIGLILVAAVWIGVRGLLAKSALEAAVPLASTISGQIVDGNSDAAQDTFEQLSSHVSSAAGLTSDPVWRVAELVPMLGSNLTAVREAAAVVKDVTEDGIGPIVELTGNINVADFKPHNKAIALQPLIDARVPIATASASLRESAKDVHSIDTSATFSLVKNAVEQLQDVVTAAAGTADTIDRAVALLPGMLGAAGERNLLLMFQNPAELRAGGGLVGAFALLHAQDGRIELTQQATATDFPRFDAPVIELPVETQGLYGGVLTGTYVGNVTMTPQFALSGALTREMWRQHFGVNIDGVLSLDPVALSYLLRATGPITLVTGDVLTSENAVQLLLTDVYARYSEPAQQDLFFAAAAASVFEAISSGNLDPTTLISALAQAGEERRLLLWSAHEQEQKRIAETTLAGNLPLSDAETQRFGVYLNDSTGSKMGPHLDTVIGVGAATCRQDGRPQYGVDITLTNTAPTDAATALPNSVTGPGTYGVAQGNIGVIASVYGPKGSDNLGVTRNGGEAVPHHSTTDSGYPVSATAFELVPGESVTVRANFLGPAPFDGQLAVEKTPEVSPNDIRRIAIACDSQYGG
jgi:hypothetical protein